MKDKILELLGSGNIPHAVIANAVGCDSSYISQLLQDETFAMEVAKRRCANLTEATNRDAKYDSIEDILLKKLEDLLPFMLRPRDVLDALTKVNAAKRRGAGLNVSQTSAPNVVINLTLPSHAVQTFKLSKEAEVIEVGGRALVNLPAASLMKSLENRSPTHEQQSAQPAPLRLSTKQAERSVYTEDSV